MPESSEQWPIVAPSCTGTGTAGPGPGTSGQTWTVVAIPVKGQTRFWCEGKLPRQWWGEWVFWLPCLRHQGPVPHPCAPGSLWSEALMNFSAVTGGPWVVIGPPAAIGFVQCASLLAASARPPFFVVVTPLCPCLFAACVPSYCFCCARRSRSVPHTPRTLSHAHPCLLLLVCADRPGDVSLQAGAAGERWCGQVLPRPAVCTQRVLRGPGNDHWGYATTARTRAPTHPWRHPHPRHPAVCNHVKM